MNCATCGRFSPRDHWNCFKDMEYGWDCDPICRRCHGCAGRDCPGASLFGGDAIRAVNAAFRASTEATERPDLRAAARGVVQAWNAGARTGMGLTPMWTAMEDLVAALAGASPSEPEVLASANRSQVSSTGAAPEEQRAPCHAWCWLPKDHPGLCEGDR